MNNNLAGVTDFAGWKRKRPEVVKRFLYILGLDPMPPRKPLNAHIVSGHAPGPWGAKVQYQHHGIWLARHGYAAFVLDTVEFGEAPGIHHGTHDLGMWYCHSLGYTPAGP